MSAILQAAAEVDDESDPDRRTTALRSLDEWPAPERPTIEVLPLEAPTAGGEPEWAQPTLQMRPLTARPAPALPAPRPGPPRPPPPPSTPRPMIARGSASIRQPRGTRRSCEILRIDDIKGAGKPDGDAGQKRNPTR